MVPEERDRGWLEALGMEGERGREAPVDVVWLNGLGSGGDLWWWRGK